MTFAERMQHAKETAEEIAEVQTLYPKYSKAAHSLVEHGDETGLMRRRDAESAIRLLRLDRLSHAPQSPRKDTHRYRYRVSCRLPDDTYALFKNAQEHMGYKTAQECLDDLIRDFIDMTLHGKKRIRG